jgi:hypothetical protein
MPGSPGWLAVQAPIPGGTQAALRRMSQLDVAIRADTRWTSSGHGRGSSFADWQLL